MKADEKRTPALWRWSSEATGLFGIALLIRLATAALSVGRVPAAADGTFYDTVARRIALGHGYSWLWPDGTVTNAAHYPVGYPALLGFFYRVFGEGVAVGFFMNALIGALAAPLAYALGLEAGMSRGDALPRRVAWITGLIVALLPSLWLYTPALMTEGPILTLSLLAAVFALKLEGTVAFDASRAFLACLGLGLTVGIAALFRPQSIALAPLLAFFMSRGAKVGRKLKLVLLSTLVAFAVVTPWTLRNCQRMDACTFVSANGGWNLLIGTFPEGRGGFAPIEGERVPLECREVFPEVAKDRCFGRAGARRIAEAPWSWLSLVPEKLRVTFDFAGAAAEYLHRTGAIGDPMRLGIGGLEIVTQRILFLAALLGLARGRSGRGTKALLALAAVGFIGLGAYWGHLCLLLVLLAGFGRAPAHQRLLALTLGLTALVHSVFFGAGRYSLPVLPFFAPLAALAVPERWLSFLTGRRSAPDN